MLMFTHDYLMKFSYSYTAVQNEGGFLHITLDYLSCEPLVPHSVNIIFTNFSVIN